MFSKMERTRKAGKQENVKYTKIHDVDIDREIEEPVSLESVINEIGFGKFQIFILIFASVRQVANGCIMFTMPLVGPNLQCEWKLPNLDKALLTGILPVASVFSSPLSGWFGDRFGRRRTILLFLSCQVYFSILSAAAPSYKWMLCLRFLIGVSTSGLVPVYVLEFMPTNHRRILAVLPIAFCVGGIFIALLGLSTLQMVHWRWFIILTETLCLFGCTAILYFLPESPRFAMISGNEEKAHEILQKAARVNGKDIFDKRMRLEVPMKKTNERGSICELFTRRYIVTTLLLMAVWFVSNFAVDGTLYLTTEIFHVRNNPCKGSRPTKKIENPWHCNACQRLRWEDYINLFLIELGGIPTYILTYSLMGVAGRVNIMRGSVLFAFFVSCLLVFCLPHLATIVVLFITNWASCIFQQVRSVYIAERYPTTIRGIANGVIKSLGRFGASAGAVLAQYFLRQNPRLALGGMSIGLSVAIGAVFLLTEETKNKPLADTTGDKQQKEKKIKPKSFESPLKFQGDTVSRTFQIPQLTRTFYIERDDED